MRMLTEQDGRIPQSMCPVGRSRFSPATTRKNSTHSSGPHPPRSCAGDSVLSQVARDRIGDKESSKVARWFTSPR